MIFDYRTNCERILESNSFTTYVHRYREVCSLMQYLREQGMEKDDIISRIEVIEGVEGWHIEDFDKAWERSLDYELPITVYGITETEYEFIESKNMPARVKMALAAGYENRRNLISEKGYLPAKCYKHWVNNYPTNELVKRGLATFKWFEPHWAKNDVTVDECMMTTTVKVTLEGYEGKNVTDKKMIPLEECKFTDKCSCCGKEYVRANTSRTDMCPECYAKHRSSRNKRARA